MDEEALRLSGKRSPTAPPSYSTKNIIKPAWLTAATSSTTSTTGPDPTHVEERGHHPPGDDIAATSTPTPASKDKKIPSKRSGRKRTLSTSTPRNQRVRTRPATSNEDGHSDETVDVIDVEMQNSSANVPPPDPLEGLKKYMKDQLSVLRTDMNSDIKSAVSEIANQVSSNTNNIAKLRDEIDNKIEKAVAESVSKEIKRHGTSYSGDNTPDENDGAYWRSRRSVRCWPIKGNDSDLWGLAGDFFTQILGIPPSSLPQECVESVRRISIPRSNRPQKIKNEVLVTFREVATRDMVFSYATNLANYRQSSDPPGIRLDYPDHLRRTFSTLEWYGILLKSELGGTFKRSIKFEDSTKSMRIDVLFPGDERWTQIPLEIASEEVEKRKRSETAATRVRLGSISNNVASRPTTPAITNPGPSTTTEVDLPMSATLLRNKQQPPPRWGNRV